MEQEQLEREIIELNKKVKFLSEQNTKKNKDIYKLYSYVSNQIFVVSFFVFVYMFDLLFDFSKTENYIYSAILTTVIYIEPMYIYSKQLIKKMLVKRL